MRFSGGRLAGLARDTYTASGRLASPFITQAPSAGPLQARGRPQASATVLLRVQELHELRISNGPFERAPLHGLILADDKDG